LHSDFEGEVWAKLGGDLQAWKSRSSSGLGHRMQDLGRAAGRSRQAQRWGDAARTGEHRQELQVPALNCYR